MADAPKSAFSGLAALVAGGQAVVVGILTALGIKDDAIARLIREEPKAILFFGALLAAAIALGATAQLVTLPGSFPVPLLAALAIVPVVAFPFAADAARNQDVPDGLNLVLILVGSVIGALITLVLFSNRRVDMNGSVLAIGAVCFALGTYGAVRLAVDSESTFQAAEISDAKVVYDKDARPRITATVKATGLRRCQQLAVAITDAEPETRPGATQGETEVVTELLAQEVLATGYGGADGTATIKLDTQIRPSWLADGREQVTLQAQVTDRPEDSCEVEDTAGPVVTQTLVLPKVGAPIVTPAFGADRTLTLGVSVSDHPVPAAVRVQVRGYVGKACTLLSRALLPVDGRGDLTSSVIAAVGDDVTRVVVDAVLVPSPPSGTRRSCAPSPPGAVVLDLTPPPKGDPATSPTDPSKPKG